MSNTEFAAMCAAFYIQYKPLLLIFCGVLVGAGGLTGAVLGLIAAFREIGLLSP